MMKYFFLPTTLPLFVGLLISCGAATQKEAKETDTEKVAANVPIQFNNAQQETLFNAYEKLKNDLVKSDYQASKESALALSTMLKNYKGCETTGDFAIKISRAKDIKEQRSNFTTVSNDLIAMFKHADLKNGAIYVQHCPMANNGDGGDWLSSVKKIQNPYYGDEMMECGAVVDEIRHK